MSEDTPLRFNCPICGKPLQRPATSAGKRDRCPKCGEPFIVPPAKPADTAKSPPLQ